MVIAMLNERKHQRHRPVIYLKVFDRDTGGLIGHVVDIAEQGMMLVTEAPLETGRHLHLQFHPPGDWDTEEAICFEAEVRWSRPEANPDLHDVGLVVISQTAQFRQAVERLISGYVFSGAS